MLSFSLKNTSTQCRRNIKDDAIEKKNSGHVILLISAPLSSLVSLAILPLLVISLTSLWIPTWKGKDVGVWWCGDVVVKCAKGKRMQCCHVARWWCFGLVTKEAARNKTGMGGREKGGGNGEIMQMAGRLSYLTHHLSASSSITIVLVCSGGRAKSSPPDYFQGRVRANSARIPSSRFRVENVSKTQKKRPIFEPRPEKERKTRPDSAISPNFL